jgi:putative transposase
LIIFKLIKPHRHLQARYGCAKLYLDIKDDLIKNGIKMGRDKFYAFMRNYGLLIKKTKRYHITTDSNHGFYKSEDLTVNLDINQAEQVFVSDITYIKLNSQHAYLALVTDAYSKKIMGYKIDTNMRVQLVKDALQMAVNKRIYKHRKTIHHSDRGIQYCCPDFSEFAQNKGFILSTTQNSSPYENAVAERVNGILKQEFGLGKTIPNLKTAQKMVKQAIEIYNKNRRHYSLNMKTPEFAHLNQKHKYKSYRKLKKNILAA